MWHQVNSHKAAKILANGGKIDLGFFQWEGTIKLARPNQWRKGRKCKALARKLEKFTGDGLWAHKG